MTARFVLRVFTHPACSGCGRAVEETWEVAEGLPDVEIRTVSLEGKAGLAEAHSEGVTIIPTVILGTADEELDRWVGTPEQGAIREALDRHSGARALA